MGETSDGISVEAFMSGGVDCLPLGANVAWTRVSTVASTLGVGGAFPHPTVNTPIKAKSIAKVPMRRFMIRSLFVAWCRLIARLVKYVTGYVMVAMQ
jgi:hypothetical protein